MRFVAVDCETEMIRDHQAAGLRVGLSVPDLVVTAVSDFTAGTTLVGWEDEKAHRDMLRVVRAARARLVMFNGAFDLAVLSRAFPALEPLLRDMVYAGEVLDLRQMFLLRAPDYPSGSPTLADVVKRVLGIDLPKPAAVRTGFERGRPLTEEEKQYAMSDAHHTLRAAQALWTQGYGTYRYPGGRPAPQRAVGAWREGTPPICPDVEYSRADLLRAWYLEPQGIAVNRPYVEEQRARLVAERDAAVGRLLELGMYSLVRVPGAEPTPESAVAQAAARLSEKPLGGKWTRRADTALRLYRVRGGLCESVEARPKANQAALERAFVAFAAARGLKTVTTPTGRVSLRREHWKDHYRDMPDTLRVYMDHQKTQKLLTSFVEPLHVCGADRVYPRYHVACARTGRWSCTRPNAQQVPRSMRALYRADPHCVLVTADYPSLELYTLAEAMICQGIRGPLLAGLEAGGDLHRRTAALMFRVEEETVSDEQRQVAKISNFSLSGGMGVPRFLAHARKSGLDWDESRARSVRERWFHVYGDVARYLRELHFDPYRFAHFGEAVLLEDWGFDPAGEWPSGFELGKAMNGGKIYTVRLPTGRLLPDRTYSQAANAPFQALGADVVTVAFSRACAAGLDVRAVVHDSITVNAPPHGGHGDVLCAAMASALTLVCPHVPSPVIKYKKGELWT